MSFSIVVCLFVYTGCRYNKPSCSELVLMRVSLATENILPARTQKRIENQNSSNLVFYLQIMLSLLRNDLNLSLFLILCSDLVNLYHLQTLFYAEKKSLHKQVYLIAFDITLKFEQADVGKKIKMRLCESSVLALTQIWNRRLCFLLNYLNKFLVSTSELG